MANTIKKLYEGQPGTTNGTLYTVPASNKTIIKNIILCNTTSSAATVTLNIVPNAGTVNANNRIISAYSVAAGDTVIIDLTTVMDTAGDTIQGLQGTSSAITVYISGVEVA